MINDEKAPDNSHNNAFIESILILERHKGINKLS
jgi:hypothetical protein